MLHELDFADVYGLSIAYSLIAETSGVQSCEIDLDRMQLTFTTRFPLADATRDALNRAGGLVSARCSPSPKPAFELADALAAVVAASG
ncbi:MAG TPA: hypothetical protein VFT98_01555 [Myxococcota bacterium]|nr:hypothetical protein [Myxococcota bacterium]